MYARPGIVSVSPNVVSSKKAGELAKELTPFLDYPEEKLTRGLRGEHRVIIEYWPDILKGYIDEYENLWKKSTPVNLSL